MDLWQKLKKEYVRGGISYRQLCSKYSVPFGTLKRIARDEKWTTLREQAKDKADTKLVDTVSTENAKAGEDIYHAADLLLRKLTEAVAAREVMDSQSIRQFTAALKDLKEIKNIRSDRDLREQEARIAKLVKDAEKEDTSNDISINIGGWDERWRG